MVVLRFILHYGIHFLVPVVIAFLFWRKNVISAAVILLAGIMIDVDHLWANPMYDPNRCSIGFHTLHTYPFIMIYALLLFYRRTRIYGVALMLHILADTIDCLLLPL